MHVIVTDEEVAAHSAKMMEETVPTDESYDSFDEHYDRPAERWAPLGAPGSSPVPSSFAEAR